MKKNKFLVSFFVLIMTILMQLSMSDGVLAASKKVKALEPEELEKVTKSVDRLTKKIYSLSLFSPSDNDEFVEVNTKLGSVVNATLKDPVYARLYYDLAVICKEREYKDDAIQYFLVVKEKFASTSYSKKADLELKRIGYCEGETQTQSAAINDAKTSLSTSQK